MNLRALAYRALAALIDASAAAGPPLALRFGRLDALPGA